MSRLIRNGWLTFVCVAFAAASTVNADWPAWRGPNTNGAADKDANPPTDWSDTKNIAWRAPLPGRGHGSPIVVGQRVIIAVADVEAAEQSVYCFHRANGSLQWKTVAHQGGFVAKMNKKATHASTTPAADDERIYVNFLNNDAVYTTALSLEGEQLWQTKICNYKVHQGYGSSPALYGPLVIVSADNKAGGAICGLNRKTGEVVWKRDRPKKPNYASPVVVRAAGKDQLIFIGCDLVTSLDPLTGETNWEIEGATTECVITTVTDGKHIYTTGGYPRNHTAAVNADGSGEIAWENGNRIYVPSMVLLDGKIYGVMDAGVAGCWDAGTGKQHWKQRLGGTFTASLVAAGDRIYATNEAGETFVFRANSDSYQEIQRNQLGDETFATPAIAGGELFARIALQKNGKRQEQLVCIGAKQP